MLYSPERQGYQALQLQRSLEPGYTQLPNWKVPTIWPAHLVPLAEEARPSGEFSWLPLTQAEEQLLKQLLLIFKPQHMYTATMRNKSGPS